jgi:hypothetical protein
VSALAAITKKCLAKAAHLVTNVLSHLQYARDHNLSTDLEFYKVGRILAGGKSKSIYKQHDSMSNQGCQSATNLRKRTALSAAYHPYISLDYGFSMFRQISY